MTRDDRPMLALSRGLPRLALAAATLFAVAACSSDGGPTEPDGDGQVATVVVTPAADTLTALGDTVQLSARALDRAGDEIPGVSFTWTSLDDGVVTVGDGGVATAAGNGAARITATAEGVSDTASLAVVQLVETVSVSPSAAVLTTAGATQQFTAAGTDANGNVVSDATVLWQSSRPGVASVDTTGLATAEASGETTITASAQGVPGNAVLTVDQQIAGAAFIDQPTDATAGEAIDPAIRIEVRDDAGNRVEDAEITVALSILDNPGGATPHGTRTKTTTAGVASFGGIWLDKAGAGYTLAVEVGGTPADTSAAFDITAAAPTRVGFVQQPTATEGSQSLAPVTVAVQDEFGNTVPGATHAVELGLGPDAGLAQGPDGGDAILSGETRVQAVDGLATFDSVQIDLPGSYTLDATSFPLSGARSASFDIFLTFASVAAGQDLSCARTDPGHVYCWGRSKRPTLLQPGSTTFETVFETWSPIHNDGGDRQAEVRVSDGLGVGVIDDAGTWAHFYDASESGTTDVFAPTPMSGATSDGLHHCAISDGGDAHCWGTNPSGQLGNADTAIVVNLNEPVPVAGGLGFAQLDAGDLHTCGVTTADTAYCWGSDEYGQLGADGAPAETDCFRAPCSLTPSAVAGGLSFASVTAGGSHSCGVTTTGEAYCWGRAVEGQLGNPEPTSSAVPLPVDDPAGGAVTWDRLSAGEDHTCGVTTSGAAYCWGNNGLGQLGIGGAGGDEAVPQPVNGGLSFAAIDAGGHHTCAITPDGDIYCWGDGSSGQLGDGTTALRTEPTRVVQ